MTARSASGAMAATCDAHAIWRVQQYLKTKNLMVRQERQTKSCT